MLEKSLHQHPPVLQVGVQGGAVQVRATPVQLAVLHLVHVRTPIGHWEAERENNNIILITKNEWTFWSCFETLKRVSYCQWFCLVQQRPGLTLNNTKKQATANKAFCHRSSRQQLAGWDAAAEVIIRAALHQRYNSASECSGGSEMSGGPRCWSCCCLVLSTGGMQREGTHWSQRLALFLKNKTSQAKQASRR